MNKIFIDPSVRIEVEYFDLNALFRPVVFRQGEFFCSIYGPDIANGVLGCGESPEEALSDWEAQLKVRLTNPRKNDEIVDQIRNAVETLRSILEQSRN